MEIEVEYKKTNDREDEIIYIPPKEQWKIQIDPRCNGHWVPCNKVIWEEKIGENWLEFREDTLAIVINKPKTKRLFRVTAISRKPLWAHTKELRIIPNNE